MSPHPHSIAGFAVTSPSRREREGGAQRRKGEGDLFIVMHP